MNYSEVPKDSWDNAFSQAEVLSQLRTGEIVTAADYQDRFLSIFENIPAGRTNEARMARDEAADKYVTNEPDGPLKDFARVMLRGATDNDRQDDLNRLRLSLARKSGRDKSEVRTEERSKENALKYEVQSNHYLRDFIDSQRDNFTRTQFTTWYTRAREGRVSTAAGSIAGAAAEIILKDAVEKMGGIRKGSGTYGDVEQDAEGGDVVGQLVHTGEWIYLDAKSGKQESDFRVNDKNRITLVIGVDMSIIDEHFHAPANELDKTGFQADIALSKALKHRQDTAKASDTSVFEQSR